MMDVSEDAIRQETELDGVDIPNLPIKEAERRAGWRKPPQKVRIAIRSLHRQFGHVPEKVLLNLLRSARVSKQCLEAVKYFRCIEREESAPRRTGHKTSIPNRYAFNSALGIDVLEILDADGAKYQVGNISVRDMFPTCGGCENWPTSAKCLETIKKRWISWAGSPNTVQCDRGLHNRGVLAQYMSAHGIHVYHAPLATPEAAGRVERHGGVLKGMARKVIAQTQARGEVEIQSVLDESCLTKTWPASRVIGQGNENQNVWVLCENIPVLVSAQNIRPAGDAEALAHGHSIIPEAIVRGHQEFKDATAVPPEEYCTRRRQFVDE